MGNIGKEQAVTLNNQQSAVHEDMPISQMGDYVSCLQKRKNLGILICLIWKICIFIRYIAM